MQQVSHNTPARAVPKYLCVVLIGVAAVAWQLRANRSATEILPVATALGPDSMQRIPGGEFTMGGVDPAFPDQRPLHPVRLPSFWFDATLVTNAQFARFVEATDYQTTAERRGWSMVFDRDARAWQRVAGATWRRPFGPESSIVGREDRPVVQVSWFDASAYAVWAGKRLPTEAEYEFAARSGLIDCDYPWGRDLNPAGRPTANYWQGRFPEADAAEDGFTGPSPVRAFPPTRYGLSDMAGNVWCWCSDWYDAQYYAGSRRHAPRGPADGRERVRRGGSWLSAVHYGDGLRVYYRGHGMPDEATNDVGFRCARNDTDSATAGLSTRRYVR